MSAALIAGALWVVAGTIVAMLPMRLQYAPGLTLLLMAPALIVWLGWSHGWWVSILAALAFLSMFRRPLRYLWGKYVTRSDT